MIPNAIAPDYQIAPSIGVAGELQRIALAEVDLAVEFARQIALDSAPSVHECRKAIKRIRALVHLCADAEGGTERLLAIDRALRSAGRLLAVARDAHALHQTAARLADVSGHTLPVKIRAARSTPGPEVVATCIELLLDAREGLASRSFESDSGVEDLLTSVSHTGRSAVARMDRFRASERASLAHAWRKAVQRYTNQVRLMSSFLPAPAVDRLPALKELADLLGDYQDLNVLQTALESGSAGCGRQARRMLLEAARSRRLELRQASLSAGASLFGRQVVIVPAGTAGRVRKQAAKPCRSISGSERSS